MRASCLGEDPLFHAIVDPAAGSATGVASYLRIDPNHGSIEVGGINYSPLLQRKPAATEAMYLMMKRAFELGYRRYEWKCDALNAASRLAAERFGFTYEGIFRQHMILKGRNRDTAWFSMIDSEWPRVSAAFEQWLAPTNFDGEGRQKRRLAEIRSAIS
jgi:RimJ/RimL family protein N-acetyltransferase